MTYYRVCSRLPVIAPQKSYETPEQAWRAWERAAASQAPNMTVAQAKESVVAVLIAGTTRRAVEEADGLSEPSGSIGQGKWHRVEQNDD